MVWNKFMSKNINKKELEEPKKNDLENEIKDEEKWVWVEGYKGTDKNMCCMDNFQYELGKMFVYNGNEEINKYGLGFHLCLELKHCFSYYDIKHKNRFFKVKALVKKEDLREVTEYKKQNYIIYNFNYPMGRDTDSVLVAKEIEFIEEISMDDNRIINYIKDSYSWIETEDEIEKYINDMDFNYGRFVEIKFKRKMKELGFSDLYVTIKFDEFDLYSRLKKFFDKAKSLTDENISKDLIIYLLETKFKN